MKTRPKDIGTEAETAVKKVLLPFWPTADRQPLRGGRDQGDIGGTGPFIWEVKGGNVARKMSTHAATGMLAVWMLQTRVEQGNADKKYGILVTARPGFGKDNADRWWAWVPIEQLAELMGGEYLPVSDFPVRLELGHLLEMLADRGYCPDAIFPEEIANLELVSGE